MSYSWFPKLGVITDCATHMILAVRASIGPRPDVDELLPLLEQMSGGAVFDTLLLDAGYDSEANHELLRDYLDIESIIPARAGRPTDKLPAGKWRWLMATDFDQERYGQRWQVETVMSMIKRSMGEALTARNDRARHAEMRLMAVTHNLMILRLKELFYRACRIPLSGDW